MKRASEMIFPAKKSNHSRKMSPSAFYKPSEFLVFKPKLIFNHQDHMLAPCVIENAIDFIMTSTELGIEQIEQHKFCLMLKRQIERIILSIESSWIPKVQQKQASNLPDEQPQTSFPDPVCGSQRLMQKKLERNHASATTPTSPVKQTSFQYRIKNVRSSKQNFRLSKMIHKSSTKRSSQGLIPLSFVDSEKDLRLTQIELMYRDKFIMETSKISDEVPQLMQTAGRFKNLNARQSEQFSFDYNGEKIPIAASTSLKKNQINVLKTICRLHKDKTEIKNMKKIQQKVSYAQIEKMAKSNKNLMDNLDIKVLKKGIEESVSWQGKLASLKMISEANQSKVESS